MSLSTPLRSAFWLTEKLGLTSHPPRIFLRGEKEIVKHPSPSTYPEMYEATFMGTPTGVWVSRRLAMIRCAIALSTYVLQSIRGQSHSHEMTSLDITLAQPHAAVRASPILAGTGLFSTYPTRNFAQSCYFSESRSASNISVEVCMSPCSSDYLFSAFPQSLACSL